MCWDDVRLPPLPARLKGRASAQSWRDRYGSSHGLGNCRAERLRKAGIAPVIHMQPILRHKGFERQVLGLVPMPHLLETMKDTNTLRLGGRGRAGPVEEDYTVLSTIHSAKGQEWRNVRILNAVDGCIPSSMAASAEEIEEERRLPYVAMTRAKDILDRIVPHRAYNYQQAKFGDDHSYTSISQFIPKSIRHLFDCQHWHEPTAQSVTGGEKIGPDYRRFGQLVADLAMSQFKPGAAHILVRSHDP
jgi:superfamily I DNA/RNA helicase